MLDGIEHVLHIGGRCTESPMRRCTPSIDNNLNALLIQSTQPTVPLQRIELLVEPTYVPDGLARENVDDGANPDRHQRVRLDVERSVDLSKQRLSGSGL